MSKKKKLTIPKFKNEDQERNFWDNISLEDYFDKKDFEKVLMPELKPTTKSISIRVPVFLLAMLKQKSNEIGMPYQSLIKFYISQGLGLKKIKKK